MDFIKEFLLYSILENKNKMIGLKNRNDENIIKLEQIYEDELRKL